MSTAITDISASCHLTDTPSNFYPADPVALSVLYTWFFAPLLPWQKPAWQHLTQNYPNVPHGMLFAGNAGTGKRAFVYRFVAWVLCQQRPSQSDTMITRACGQCDSCQWLMAGTHPGLMILPSLAEENPATGKKPQPRTTHQSNNSTRPKTPDLHDQAPTQLSPMTLKIDTIRQMQPFVQHASHGSRIVVIHQADNMTMGASNALLKTLEEPADNVLLLLISDHPSRLLPTIRSRLQAIAVSQLTPEQSLNYMQQLSPASDPIQLAHVNDLSGYAPLVALDMLHSTWYGQRQAWLASWQALRSNRRTVIQASDYWQQTLTLNDFLYLSQMMISTLTQQCLGLISPYDDVAITKLDPLPSPQALYQLQETIDAIWRDKRQHLQDRLCYDKLLQTLQRY